MEIIEKMIPKGRPNRPGYSMQPKYITIHDTANPSKGADALAHARFLQTTTQKSSWHYTVDDQRIVQHLPVSESAWHAGDGANGTGNRSSIGIEICENEGIDRQKAEERAAELVAYLLQRLGLPLEAVVPHKHWSGKNCPHLLLPRWGEFIAGVKGKLAEYQLAVSQGQEKSRSEAEKAAVAEAKPEVKPETAAEEERAAVKKLQEQMFRLEERLARLEMAVFGEQAGS